MNDEEKRQAREIRAYELASLRIVELHADPIRGNFDARHFKAIHAYIFQDTPQYRPGITRKDAPNWTKHRALEGRRDRYDVPYVSRGVAARIRSILAHFGGPQALQGLTLDAAAARLARLCGDLDHAHGFHEGNSRTLREFFRELAQEAGFALDWTGTGITAKERDELYVARDLAVTEREFSGLTQERAMQTADRREYESFFALEQLRAAAGARTLEVIIREGLSTSLATAPARP